MKEEGGKHNKKRLPKLYFAVITPKGEPNTKSTYYFQECQTKQLAEEVIGLPLKISHNHILKNGEESPPAGIVVQAHVHPQTGDVWAGFITYDTPTGKLARTFLGEDGVLPKKLCMGETSLGFDIITDRATGKPRGHVLKELSICYSGARPGCQIKGSSPFPTTTSNNDHDDSLSSTTTTTTTLAPTTTQEEKDIPPPPPAQGGRGAAADNLEKYNPKIITGIINNYISGASPRPKTTTVIGGVKEFPNKKMEKSNLQINIGDIEPIVPRPDDAKGPEQFFKNVNMAAMTPQTSNNVISAKASSSINNTNDSTTMDDNTQPSTPQLSDAAAAAMVEKLILQSQQRTTAATAQKRPLDEEQLTSEQQEQKRQRYRLDFSKYVEGPPMEWQEPAMPEGLNEVQQQAFKQVYAGQKAVWERNQQLGKEIRRKLLNRIQGATDNFVPTYIEQAARQSKDVDKTALEALFAGMAETPLAEDFVQLIEAQAKQGQDIAARQKDINQLEAEYQENLKKLAAENAELRKNQARPPIAPQQPPAQPQQQQFRVNIPSQQYQQQTLADELNKMSPIARIIAQASINTNAMQPNRPGNKMPWELIKENSRAISEAWERAKTQPY